MPDYFDTTARLAQQRSQGIERGFGVLGEGLGQAAQGMQTQQMLKQFGIIRDEEVPLTSKDIKDFAKKQGVEIQLDPNLPEDQQLQKSLQFAKYFGLPTPKPQTKTVFDSKKAIEMGMTYKPDMFGGSAEFKPTGKSEYDKYIRDQRTQAHEEKKQKEQDTLENQAINRVTGIRGDMSIRNIEQQRDATILAYRTLKDAKKEGRLPTQFEYTDILGQIWKARTGGVPTDQVMHELNTPNIEQNLRKLYTNLTGDPAAGYSTQKIVNALTSFIENTGQQLDTMHDRYMKPHLIKPEGLDEKRWENIQKTARGMPFSEMLDESPKSDMGTQVTNATGLTGGTQTFNVKGKTYKIPSDKVEEFKKDMGL